MNGQDRRPWWQYALICVPAIILAGVASGYLANSGFSNPWFAALEKPAFMPPGWVFPVVWTTLYALMGVALAVVLALPSSKERRDALWLFGGQLTLNFAWSPVFFRLHMIEVALVIIVVMLLMAVVTAKYFRKLSPVAGWLMLPYLLWLCMATALNYEVGMLNPGADAAPIGIIGAK